MHAGKRDAEHMTARLVLNGSNLSLEQAAAVLGPKPPELVIADEALERCRASRAIVESVIAADDTVYGVNTGFGALARQRIAPDQLGDLQRNLLLSHACGVGEPLPVEISRLMLVLRIQALVHGNSGVRVELLERLLFFYARDWIPVVPSQGSVGASGDLAPLAHMAVTLLGEGELWVDGARVPARDVISEVGPFELTAKEGLALINGTQCMTAIGVEVWQLATRLAVSADIATAMTIEALRGSVRPFDPRVQELRGHEGQKQVAAHLIELLEGSQIIPSHEHCDKVQDPYSMRCVPQVHGAVRDAIAFVEGVLANEINAATDNPLVFDNGDVISAGNFHGQPVAQALDFLGIALSTLANISERRIENLVNPKLSGLPPFLARNAGLESGYMIAQVVAASLASENKSLAHPASVDTIPTSANQEDHVSMGVTAARHAKAIALNTAKVLGIEVLIAAEALDVDHSLTAGKGVEAAYARVRESIAPLRSTGDRYLAPDLEAAAELVRSGSLSSSS